jgi:hypothetical protein
MVSERDGELDELASDSMDMDRPPSIGPTDAQPNHSASDSPAGDAGETWQRRYELITMDLVEMRNKSQGDPQMRRERRADLLQRLLEAQRLIGHSIDQMRDCLLKFKEDGHPVDPDVLD